MSRYLLLFASLILFSMAGNAFAGTTVRIGQTTYDLSASQPQGVFCEINGVRLMAKTAADCEKAGGAVTHMITRTVTPAGEATGNPEEEPEIQRKKDKEPEAQ